MRPIKPNSTIDKLAAVTDVSDPDFMPSDKMEFRVALEDIISSTLPEDIPRLYASLKKAIAQSREDVGDEKMTTKKTRKITSEAELRNVVRTLIREATLAEADEETEAETPEEPKKRRKSKSVNQEGELFNQLAQEFGLSVAGAKRAVDHALAKAHFLATEFEGDELDSFVLEIVANYIEFLASSGELDAADAQLLKDNPQLVASLDGFREFADKQIRKFPGYKQVTYKFIGKDPETGRNIK